MSPTSTLRLIILGAAPVGQQLARLAVDVGFEVMVIDHRETLLAVENFPASAKLLCGEFSERLPALEVVPQDYVAIVSQVWSADQQALELLAERPLAYLGMIGCRRKLAEIYPALLAKGISQAALDRIYAPIGLHIGSHSAAEIAISIAAELIAVRSGKISRPPAT